jgi:iron-sulfur cluster insertion protein
MGILVVGPYTGPAAWRSAPERGKSWREEHMITLTEKAVTKVREIREAEGLGEQGLRVRVIGGGCSGFSYDLFFEDETSDVDQTFESHGIKLYVDMMSFQYLEGVEIDYVEGLHGAGFKFLNPQAKSTCGCGSSFSA